MDVLGGDLNSLAFRFSWTRGRRRNSFAACLCPDHPDSQTASGILAERWSLTWTDGDLSDYLE